MLECHKTQDTRRPEPEKSRSGRISRRHDSTRSTTRTGGNQNYDRNVNGAAKSRSSSQANHTCIPAVVDNDERDMFVRSANILKKKLRGRTIKISPAMDTEERFHQKRLGHVKSYIHTTHYVPLVQIKLNRLKRHVSVDGQIVIITCACGSLKYHKISRHRS